MVKRVEENAVNPASRRRRAPCGRSCGIRPPCVRPIWRAKPEVARKLYPAIRRVFERARIVLRDEHGITMPDNPALWADLKATAFDPLANKPPRQRIGRNANQEAEPVIF